VELEVALDLVSPPLVAGALGDDGVSAFDDDESPPEVLPPPSVFDPESPDPELGAGVASPLGAFFAPPLRLSVL
jgi:hypothetical protein